MKSKYVKKANQYIEDILSGKKKACKWVKRACERQKNDIEKLKKGGYEYDWSEERAHKVCQYVENLRHIKGEWARRGEKLKLEPWQIFILTTVFGWITKDGFRRFRTVYIEVPRKNAKSTLSSAVGLYMMTEDEEAGAECYSAATTRDQAKIVFCDAQSMARKDKPLRDHYGIQVNAHNINVLHTASKFEALSADGGTLDGLNIHLGILDELHAHKTRAVFDVAETGTGSRKQSLLWLITTAGSNRAGICYEQRSYSIKILDLVAEDDTYFAAIFTIDDDDDWSDPEIWEKANPNYGVSVYPEDIARLCKKALEMPSAVNNFLTKRLNVWVNADTAWMDMRKWDKCADETLDIADFEGRMCYVGVDLASKIDIAAKSYVFPPQEDIEKWTLFGLFYLPEETAENEGNSQYAGWAREGRMILTPGNVIDLDLIEEGIREDCKRFDVLEVPYDPFQATQMVSHLVEENLPMVEMRPTVLNFSEPMKELEKLTVSGELQHTGCPIMTWCVSNVVCHVDAKDNIYPRKERLENKIDGAVSSIMALGRAMVGDDKRSVYEGRGVVCM